MTIIAIIIDVPDSLFKSPGSTAKLVVSIVFIYSLLRSGGPGLLLYDMQHGITGFSI